MEIRTVAGLPVGDSSQVAEVRRFAIALARSLDFDETVCGQVGIVITEAATNLVKHARGGQLVFNSLHDGSRHGLEVLSLDKGPGIRNVSEALRDGYSTSGSPGSGLGAMRRLASEFDAYSQPGRGTALLLRIWPEAGRPKSTAGLLETGAVSVAKPDEEVCGDAWDFCQRGTIGACLIADGLGHGFDAAEASRAARQMFRANCYDAPGDLLERIHPALRATRGAAVAIAQIHGGSRMVRFAGVGNICGTIGAPERTYSMVSHNGTMGHEVRKIQEFTYPWPEESVIVLHSDGISQRWALGDYPGLIARDPTTIAGVLYRDFRRESDDATIVVLRDRAGGNPA